ncbi:squalene/phytoene synthase family protein [Streptomyces sp. 184]|uniref:squalene/phytoene synthase family protein n=1 Tax=Streptomyces sp. 184 TaxID=1827526 RepID=UPI003891DAC8
MTSAIDRAGRREDYAVCEAFMRRRGVLVYAMPRMLLPPGRRPYCDAIQAFTIHVDALIDDPRVPAADRVTRYAAYARDVLALLDGDDPWDRPPGSREDAVGRRLARAFAHFTRVWEVPPGSVRQFLATMASDAHVTEYASFADLERYIRGSGVPYILWVNALLGRRAHGSQAAGNGAVAAIFGLQLVDNLRDLEEDLAAGRLGLPLEDLRTFGLDRPALVRAVRERRPTGAVRELVRFEADRALRYLEQAGTWWQSADPVVRELPRQYVRMTRYALRQAVGARHDRFPPSRRARLGWGAALGGSLAFGCARASARRLARPPARRSRPSPE